MGDKKIYSILKSAKVITIDILLKIYKCGKKVIDKTEKIIKKFDPLLRLLEILLLVLALYIAYLSFTSSSVFSENVEEHLVKIDSLFIEVEEKLHNIPASINKIDSTISILDASIYKQQKSFENNINGLSNELNKFSSSLVEYEALLTEITKASDKQLTLLKETQKKWEEELNRKPDLSLSIDKLEYLGDDTIDVFFSLNNSGNASAENIEIALKIFNYLEFISPNWVSIPNEDNSPTWCYSIPFINYINWPNDTLTVTNNYTRFKLVVKGRANNKIIIPYELYCNKGSYSGVLVIERFKK